MSGEIKNPKEYAFWVSILTAVIVPASYGLTFVASGILLLDEMATSDANRIVGI